MIEFEESLIALGSDNRVASSGAQVRYSGRGGKFNTTFFAAKYR